MKTYIINLERSEKRRRHITSEAKRHHLDFEIVKAVDGSEMSDEEIESVSDMEIVRKHPDWLSRNMIATALSHRQVYERIMCGEDTAALILEDDVKLAPGISTLLHRLEENLVNAEIVLLHYGSFEPLELSNYSSVSLYETYKLTYPLSMKGVVSAAAYVVTKLAARNLYNWILPVRIAPDTWDRFWEAGLVDRMRMVYPQPVELIGAKSTIYVDRQSWFRKHLTEFVDRHEVPILHQMLTKSRLNDVATRANFSLTDERSPLER